MKSFVLIMTLFFSFSVLSNCCAGFELEHVTIEAHESEDCEKEGPENPSNTCHCPPSCSLKFLRIDSLLLEPQFVISYQTYLSSLQAFRTLNPLPPLQPPIA